MPDGRLMITFGKLDPDGISGAAYSLSNDDGLTWGAFTFFSTPVSETAAFSPGVLTVNGTVYSVAYGSQSDGSSNANLWTSVDNGSTWSLLSEIRQTNDVGINETGIAQVGATSLLAISRDDLNLNTWGHFSNDFGLTWSSQVDYTAQVGVLQDPQLVQTRTALLLFGRQYDTTKSPNEMVAFASYDGGLTFADRTVLDTYTGLPIDGGYCWPLLRSDGKIFLVYYADSNNLREPDIKSLVLQWDRKSAN